MTGSTFWRGKRVFLTGHTGFKGGWLSLWLQHMGAEVHGYALPAPTSPSLFEAASVAQGMKHSVLGDLRDADALKAALADARPEVVFHLAAQPLVRRSYEAPAETYSTNVMGLVNLFEAVRATPGVKAVLNVTSDKCYENREWVWGYRECDPMGGYDPYSSSKGCAELITAAYRSSFFQTAGSPLIASARAGNVIGGGDWALDRLVPDTLRALEKHEPVLVRNPSATRPWQHVLEPLCGYLMLAERLLRGGAAFATGWNFGPSPEDARPVKWIVEQICARYGEGASWIASGSKGPHEAQYLALDCSKARRELGWSPKWPLLTALEKIVDWHRGYLAGEDLRRVSLEQIGVFHA
jgi:CDP-glucose 4,6-dehydratase